MRLRKESTCIKPGVCWDLTEELATLLGKRSLLPSSCGR
jgi:hypothetical protein